MQDENVLHDMQFFDVYWEEEDLTPNEKEAFEREGVAKWKEFLEKFKTIQELPYMYAHSARRNQKLMSLQAIILKQSVQNVCKPSSQMVLVYWRAFTCTHVNSIYTLLVTKHILLLLHS